MVTITNKAITLRVSMGAYRNYFKRRGFLIVDGAERPEKRGLYHTPPEDGTQQDDDSSQQETDGGETGEDEEDASESEDEEEDDLSEIPLSDMNKEQLFHYAERLGLDPGDLTKKELRELIREHLEN